MNTTDLANQWEQAWPQALTAWSRYTQLRPPFLCGSSSEAKSLGLTGSFAMIRLVDQVIVVDLPKVTSSGLEDFAVEILAHEIGHHVLAPANLTDHARSLARIRKALPTLEAHAPMVANLFTDLIINDRLQRGAGLRMDEIYRQLGEAASKKAESTSSVWTLYLRIYELLWSLPKGSLGGGVTSDTMEGDAWLGMRLIRSYASEWLRASGKFATLLLPYLVEDTKAPESFDKLQDTQTAGAGGIPSGLTESDPDEDDNLHPALDRSLADFDEDESDASQKTDSTPIERPTVPSSAQQRQPFEYGEILRAAGWPGTDQEAAVAYYQEVARRHLVKYPRKKIPETKEPIPEGLEPWNIGDPLDCCDWFQSILQSPIVIPGLTTVQRVYGYDRAKQTRPEPIDLDLYVDSSGSMPDPARHISYPALAGAIITISALRAGARVQATLWSGKHQFQSTPGFIRDEEKILKVLTAHYGGGTQFPLHVLRHTFDQRGEDERPTHILSISDSGVTTMFLDLDEKGTIGWNVCEQALVKARAGGTLALNIPAEWESARNQSNHFSTDANAIAKARDTYGWSVHAVPTLEGLVAFARSFSQQKFGPVAT